MGVSRQEKRRELFGSLLFSACVSWGSSTRGKWGHVRVAPLPASGRDICLRQPRDEIPGPAAFSLAGMPGPGLGNGGGLTASTCPARGFPEKAAFRRPLRAAASSGIGPPRGATAPQDERCPPRGPATAATGLPSPPESGRTLPGPPRTRGPQDCGLWRCDSPRIPSSLLYVLTH